jgi:DNA polymerase IV
MTLVDESRAILHVDMDAFFAAVEVLDNPDLRGKPILVGGNGPRSVVTTASYEARPYGCRSAMPMSMAKRLCPHAIVVKPNYPRYHEMSDRMFTILESYTPLVEPLSVDEAFLDVTDSMRLFGPAEHIARQIKQRVRDELELTISVGVSFNKFLAKLASDLEKPDGLTVINEANIDQVLPPLQITRIWGIGPKTARRMTEMGMRTFADIRRLPLEQLHQRFGDEGAHWHNLSYGRDERAVTSDREAKGISQEQTFSQDVVEPDQLRAVLLEQTEQVARRLRKHKRLASGVGLKIRDGEFHTSTRRQKLAQPTDATQLLWQAARGLFEHWASKSFRPIRLIGFGVSVMPPRDAQQLGLFVDKDLARQRQVDRALDQINQRYGQRTIHRAHK